MSSNNDDETRGVTGCLSSYYKHLLVSILLGVLVVGFKYISALRYLRLISQIPYLHTIEYPNGYSTAVESNRGFLNVVISCCGIEYVPLKNISVNVLETRPLLHLFNSQKSRVSLINSSYPFTALLIPLFGRSGHQRRLTDQFFNSPIRNLLKANGTGSSNLNKTVQDELLCAYCASNHKLQLYGFAAWLAEIPLLCFQSAST